MAIPNFQSCLAIFFGFVLAVAWGVGCNSQPNAGTESASATVEMVGKPAPEFTGVTQWLNTEPLKLSTLRGQVVIVHFWTNGCINCVHNYPYYKAWQEKYGSNPAFNMIGIHTPEFDSEHDVQRIRDRMAKSKLAFAVAVDNDRANWKAWGNRYWPAIYLLDKSGNIRHSWEGELHEDGEPSVTAQIDALLAEK